MRICCLLITLLLLCVLASAEETATAPPASPPAPTNVTLELRTLEYTTLIRDPNLKDNLAFTSFDGLINFFGTNTLTWDVNVAELRLYDTGAKIKWVPVALYCTPVKFAGRATIATGEGDKRTETTYTYTKAALYGVYAANANHIFDWKSKPFLIENRRVGGGIYWAAPPAQTTTKMGKKQTAVMSRVHGLEVTRSVGTPDDIWYISFTNGLEK